jgi:mono/diheme cytochrome c family protein
MRSSRWKRYGLAAALIVFPVVALASYLLWPQATNATRAIADLDASLERGRYLATISNCATCHTTKDGKPFAGGVKFHTEFGTLYSTNITSDKKTGIGRWSFEDFYQAMKHGLRPDGTPLYPAFPYPSFAKLTDADIASIYLYMQSIAPVDAPARENELRFPYNLRFMLRAWNKMFHEPAAYTPDPAQSQEWNRGAYLVQGPAHCGACHTPRNALGAERNELAFSGGLVLDEVRPGKIREWAAVNLTPAKSGLGHWDAACIVDYLKTGECDHAVVHGPMNDVILNSTRHLEDADAKAIATYLTSMPAMEAESARPPSEKQLAAGEISYTVHCGSCHLPTGLGDEGLGVTLAGNSIVQSADPSSLINVILYGPRLPPPPFVSDRSRMKPFGKRLSDEDIANLTTYVRASFNNRAGAVTPEQVRKQR